MNGMCHTCKSSNVETTFDKFMKPICKDCTFTQMEKSVS